MANNVQQKVEEGKLEHTIDAHIERVNDIRSSINALLWKINHNQDLNWPSVLDSFALLSSQISSFQKLLANDKMAALKNYTFIPLLLSQERDMETEKLTDNRVSSFNHEIVPDYLRTKPEIDVEEKTNKVVEKAKGLSQEAANRQINQLNKSCNNILALIQTKREEWRTDEGHRKNADTSSRSDTMQLVAATAFGRNLMDHIQRIPQPNMQQQPMMHSMPQPQPSVRTAPKPNFSLSAGKAPTTMKANMRVQQFPYQR